LPDGPRRCLDAAGTPIRTKNDARNASGSAPTRRRNVRLFINVARQRRSGFRHHACGRLASLCGHVRRTRSP
jgi:hypothetical protein